MTPPVPPGRPATAREALAVGDAGWRILVDENPLPVLVVSPPHGRVLAANAAAAAFYGYTDPEALAAIGVAELAAPEGAAAWVAELGRPDPGRIVHGAHLHRRRDGAALLVEAVSHELALAEAPRARLVVLTDVTERAALQRQLRHAQKMGVLGQLAAGIAHDFNNLLTVILSSVELGQGLLDRGHPAREDLDTVAYAARRAAQLTRQLLAVSRKRAPSAEVVDLNALVVAPARLFRRLLGSAIEVQVVPGSDVWPVRVDPGHIEQVLMNLVVNARDAMPGGGTLTVVTGNRVVYAPVPECPGLIPGEYALLAVHDTGVGMDPATLAHVFEPFFTTKPPGRGTGLGLATVHDIVRQWGGYVYGESTPGSGAQFSVLLPRVPC